MPWWQLIPGIIGGLGSLFGGIQASNQANQALDVQRGLLEMARRAQNYGFARQAQLDPIFLALLSQGLYRANRAPFFAGQYHRGVAPIFGALRGGRAALPVPRLIGEEES